MLLVTLHLTAIVLGSHDPLLDEAHSVTRSGDPAQLERDRGGQSVKSVSVSQTKPGSSGLVSCSPGPISIASPNDPAR